MNYIYGTWLICVRDRGWDRCLSAETKATAWSFPFRTSMALRCEDAGSHKFDYRGYGCVLSTASQTAWALLGLMAAGQVSTSRSCNGHRLPHKTAGRGRFLLARAALHRDWVSVCATVGQSEFFPLWTVRHTSELESVGFPLSRLWDVASYRRPRAAVPAGLGRTKGAGVRWPWLGFLSNGPSKADRGEHKKCLNFPRFFLISAAALAPVVPIASA